jgi:site-specific DNA-methyltransferase (adenine-specific)
METLFVHDAGLEIGESPETTQELQQHFTPAWAAEALAEKFFEKSEALGSPVGRALEPSCGLGAMLGAIPREYDAYGIEFDRSLVPLAERNSRRKVYCEDFTTTSIPYHPGHDVSHVFGNPPFRLETVERFLDKAWSFLPAGGLCGFLLAAYHFQTAANVAAWNRKWSIFQTMVPRGLFPGLSKPLVFAIFLREERERASGYTLDGFWLYQAMSRVAKLPERLRAQVVEPGSAGRTWRILVIEAVQQSGGEASVEEVYRRVEPMRHTDNPHWRSKVRQELQRGPFVSVRRGVWRIGKSSRRP